MTIYDYDGNGNIVSYSSRIMRCPEAMADQLIEALEQKRPDSEFGWVDGTIWERVSNLEVHEI
jgi:hypothetical protein